ncbi:MAG: hypothetical protein D6712_21155 [Chloroflexi bacterium]|nr:MAG: hypothetical protein D6712_21155 [Chloroflexota bacterium]
MEDLEVLYVETPKPMVSMFLYGEDARLQVPLFVFKEGVDEDTAERLCEFSAFCLSQKSMTNRYAAYIAKTYFSYCE